MAKESSFDIVSTIDLQEVDNAYQQAKKEIAQRYDLKDSGASIAFDKAGKTLTVSAPADFVAQPGHRRAVEPKLIKRGIDLRLGEVGRPAGRHGPERARAWAASSRASTRNAPAPSTRTSRRRSSRRRCRSKATSCA